MTRKKAKPAKKVEESTIDTEQLVTSVNEVIPESPVEELTETDTNTIDFLETETSEVQTVVEDIASGMVTAKVIGRNISFIDFVDGKIKHYKKGEIFTTTKERVDSISQQHIQIL